MQISMKVSDVNIDDEFISVKNDMTLTEVSKEMAKAGIPDAVVVGEGNKVLGALDDYDIISKCIAEDKDPNEMKAEEVMFSSPPVRKETELKDVHKMMEELEATMLPVTDEEKQLLGVVTIMDVLDALGREQQAKGFFSRIFG